MMIYLETQKSQSVYILEDLGMENAVIYSGHLEYFISIGYILWEIGYLVIWFIFLRFGIFYQEKSGNPVIYTNKQN
jgi:hypothetical protein